MNRKKIVIEIVSLFISALSIGFLYKASFNMNFAIFNIVLSISVLLIAQFYKRLNVASEINILLLGLIGIPFGLTTNQALKNLLFVVWLYMLLMAVYSTFHKTYEFKLIKFFIAPIEMIALSLVSPLLSLSEIQISNKKSYLMPVLRIFIGLFIAIPFLAVFLLLFYSADLAFQNIIKDLFSLKYLGDIFRIIVWFFAILWIFFGMMYHSFCKRSPYEVKNTVLKLKKQFFYIESLTILILTEILFLFFNIVQFTYLFGGEDLIKDETYTYSQYARKGFFELIIASVIGILLISFILKIKRSGSKVKSLIIRGIAVFGIVLMFPMTISSFYRLYLYEQEYGFTRLRIYSHLFTIFLMILFLMIIIKIVTKFKDRIFYFIVMLFSFLSILFVSLINVDNMITKWNISRYGKNSEKLIDIKYLISLSSDNIPALVDFYNSLDDKKLKEELGFLLYREYIKLDYTLKTEDFREYNFSKVKAFNKLKEVSNEIAYDSEKYEQSIIDKYIPVYSYQSIDSCSSSQIMIHVIKDNQMQIHPDSIKLIDKDNLNDSIAVEDSTCIDINDGEYYAIVSSPYMIEDKIYLQTEVGTSREIFLIVPILADPID